MGGKINNLRRKKNVAKTTIMNTATIIKIKTIVVFKVSVLSYRRMQQQTLNIASDITSDVTSDINTSKQKLH